jgi:hypothetical protein
MALNLNTLEIFKKAFEQFQSSNNHLSNLQNQPAASSNGIIAASVLPPAAALPSSSFSVSKILQANNEVLNKQPIVENSGQANNCDAKSEAVSCQTFARDENHLTVNYFP